MAFLLLLVASALHAQEPASCNQGLAHYRSRDYSSAQSELWTCVASGQGNQTHAVYLAQTYRNLKNCGAGLERAETELRALPGKVDLLYVAGYLNYRCEHTKESMLLASQAYRLAQKDWRIHQLFALNYISFNMPEAAKLSLRTAIELQPANAELYYQLARLYFSLGSFADSIEISKKALEILPDYPEVYHNLALSYEGSGNVPLALENFQKAVDLNRHYGRADEWPLIDFATYQRMGGHPELSIPLLEEALRVNPRSPKANYEMGELLRDMRRYQDARTYLARAVDLDPCNARAIYGLAIVTRQLGGLEQSATLFQRFKDADSKTKGSASERSCQVSTGTHE